MRTRFRAVAAELSDQSSPSLQAALLFELGALTELRVGDLTTALEYYREAEKRSASFRPALFAQARMLRAAHDHGALVRVYAKIARASLRPTDQTSALVDIGCLLEDQLAEPTAAHEAYERALRTDPECLAASVMYERSLFAHKRLRESAALVARRADATRDPALRSALAIEAARQMAADGEIDSAVETLLTTLARPGRQLSTLLCLGELSARHERPAVAARAYEDVAALLAGFAAGQTGADAAEIRARFSDAAHAANAAGFFYYSAARLLGRLDDPEQATEALRAYERAAHCAPGDMLFGLSLAAAYRSLEAPSEAHSLLAALRERADRRSSAAICFELAELAERQGDGEGALRYLKEAHALQPDAPSLQAILEDRLLDAGAFGDLHAWLATRAEAAGARPSAASRALLWRAALAAERAGEIEHACLRWQALVHASEGAERAAALREWHGLAVRAGDGAQRDAALEQLLRLPDDFAEPAERSAWQRSRLAGLIAARDLTTAEASLQPLLALPSYNDWSAHAAWTVAALRGDRARLATAHLRLAEAAREHARGPQLEAAHLTASGRALLLDGQLDVALTTLRRALALAPGHAYIRGLIERCLHVRPEALALPALARDRTSGDDRYLHQAALLHQGQLALAAGQLALARRSFDEAVAIDGELVAAQWARLRLSEREHDGERRLLALFALTEREAAAKRPACAHLELGETLAVRGEFAAAVAPLSAALGNVAIAFEAAASAALLPRGEFAESLRARALSELAEQSPRKLRRALEHERSSELMHQCPADARRLVEHADDVDEREAWLRFMVADGGQTRAAALADLRELASAGDEQNQAEFLLHAARCRAIHSQHSEADALVDALALLETAPGALASALALDEALDAGDDPDTRIAALSAQLAQLQASESGPVRAALARALLDAGAATQSLAIHSELLQLWPDDPSVWESLRVAARMAGDHQQVVVACDALAAHSRGAQRAQLLEEAAAVLHERLGQHAEAERRLREALAQAPERKPAFERLHDVLVEREDLAGLLQLLSQRIAVTDDELERVDLLYERARILRARGDRGAALTTLHELLERAQTHAGALGLCAEIYATEERWQDAVDALRRLAKSELTPGQRRLALEGSADFLEHKLGDAAGAYRELEKLLALDLADGAVHLRMARAAERCGWPKLAADALARAATSSRGPQRAHLERRAAALYAESSNPADARAALRRALLAQPDDEQAFRALFTQLPAAEREPLVRQYVDTLFQALAREPNEPDLLRALVRTGELGERPLLAQLGLFALEALVQASPEELRAAQRLRARLAPPDAPLADAGFALLLPETLTPAWLTLGQRIGGAWLELSPTPVPHAHEPTVSEPVLSAWRALFRMFAVPFSELSLHPRAQPGLRPVARASGAPLWIIGGSLARLEARDVALRGAPLVAAARVQLHGLCGEAQEAHAPHEPHTGREVRRRVRSVLAAAKLVDARDVAGSPRRLSSATRGALREAWEMLPDRHEAEQRLAQACTQLGLRASTLVCADVVAVALQLAKREHAALRAVCVTPAGSELLRFWLSPACRRLLERQGGHA